MSGHTNTKSDQYVAVLGMQFNPDTVTSSANMNTYLGPSQNLLTCRLTKAVCTLDRQSLFGRLDWWEEIANPSPLGSQNDSRAKWVGKTTLLQSRHTTAFVECSSAVRSQTSEIAVSDAPTDRSDLRRLNPPNELSPARTLAGMRQLIDSDRSPASPLLVSHPCSYRRGRSVGAFSSVRRAGRLRIANGHARNHISDIHEGLAGLQGDEPLSFRYRCASSPRDEPSTTGASVLGPGTRPVSIDKVLRFCKAGSLFPPRLDRTTRTPSSGAGRDTHGSLAPTRDPWCSSARRRADLVFGSLGNPRPEPGMSDPQMLRFCQAGHCGPSRQARTNRNLPHGSALAANRDPHGFLATRRNLPWVPRQRRRDDPQAVSGRRARGERLANPTP